MTAPIIVGYDGSGHSQAIIDFAIDEARHRQRPLLLLHVALIPLIMAPYESQLYWPEGDAARQAITDMMDGAAERAAAAVPDLDIQTEIINALTPSSALIDSTRECELMVLGSRGRGGFAGLLLGSTSAQVAAHAHCPVIVIRKSDGDGAHKGAVVLGTDGSDSSSAAAQFAFEEASLTGDRLVAIHAWQYPWMTAPGDLKPVAAERKALADESATLLAEFLAQWQEKYPTVSVEQHSISGKPRDILLEQSAGARLLVVGSRGRGGFRGLILGSTSQAMLHHAKVPVAVIHADRTEPETHR